MSAIVLHVRVGDESVLCAANYELRHTAFHDFGNEANGCDVANFFEIGVVKTHESVFGEHGIGRHRAEERLAYLVSYLRGCLALWNVCRLELVNSVAASIAAVAYEVGKVNGCCRKMAACAVAGNEQSCGVSAIEGGMFHNVGYCAVNVFYDLVHLHRHARPVAVSDESVVNAEHLLFSL